MQLVREAHGETARIAVQAALTGHFVLSSLHATDAAAALKQAASLLEACAEPYVVECLAAIVTVTDRVTDRVTVTVTVRVTVTVTGRS